MVVFIMLLFREKIYVLLYGWFLVPSKNRKLSFVLFYFSIELRI